MPLYEYTCPGCQTAFENLAPNEAAGRTANCPKCGAAVERQFSVFATHAGSAPSKSAPLPAGGCGRCGNPNGSCGWAQ